MGTDRNRRSHYHAIRDSNRTRVVGHGDLQDAVDEEGKGGYPRTFHSIHKPHPNSPTWQQVDALQPHINSVLEKFRRGEYEEAKSKIEKTKQLRQERRTYVSLQKLVREERKVDPDVVSAHTKELAEYEEYMISRQKIRGRHAVMESLCEEWYEKHPDKLRAKLRDYIKRAATAGIITEKQANGMFFVFY